ncbi:MAG: glycosyltransferase family 4 protein [Christiangramia sp.]|uniref:glycosyltransferase family 4 protein n=1 Tax=Christiangramia sp. TaxID=1931228 RepID=UPI003242D48B
MHIGFLTPEYPHLKATRSGGIGTSIKNLAEPLAKKGINVSIFIYDQEIDEIINLDRIKLHFIKKRKYPVLGWYLHRKFLQNYLNKYISVDKIDLIEAPDWTGITAFMNLKCPLVIRIHGSDTYFCHLENREQKKKNYLLEKTAIRSADHVLSVSKYSATISKKLFKLSKEIKVIPNALNLEEFIPNSKITIPERLLYFGSIIRKKGVLELAEIFKLVIRQNSKARLIMAGKDVIDSKTGKSTKTLFEDKLSENAVKKIEWLGDLGYKNIQNEINKAEIVVLPSLAEALPMTWLEAMALEKAMLTSNIGWADEIMINGITGYIENPTNHKEFAEKILKLLSDKQKAKEMGRKARKQIEEKFSSEKVIQKNLNFYKNVIENK